MAALTLLFLYRRRINILSMGEHGGTGRVLLDGKERPVHIGQIGTRTVCVGGDIA